MEAASAIRGISITIRHRLQMILEAICYPHSQPKSHDEQKEKSHIRSPEVLLRNNDRINHLPLSPVELVSLHLWLGC